MNSLLRMQGAANRAIITNACSLWGSFALTSALGVIYWWLAARQFPPEAVGFAAASISAMTLLGKMGVFGLGTLLMGELPRQPGRQESLIATALAAAGVAGGGLGLLFAISAPLISTELQPLATSYWIAGLFALGVSLTAVGLVLDEALIGLLRGELQLGRNLIVAMAKLGALAASGAWLISLDGLTIYATWVTGSLLSLAILAGLGPLRGGLKRAWRPTWQILPALGGAAARHHAINVAMEAPYLALPVVVTVLLSASMSAYFYVAWMLASVAFVGPVALAAVLYPIGARAPSELVQRIRLTLGFALVLSVLANGALTLTSDWVLSLFGTDYREIAQWSLRVLSLGIFPLMIKDHFVSICRVHGRLGRAAGFVAAGGLLELAMAAIGAQVAGLLGVSVGWLIALCIEAACMAPTVFGVATARRNASGFPASMPPTCRSTSHLDPESAATISEWLSGPGWAAHRRVGAGDASRSWVDVVAPRPGSTGRLGDTS